MILLLHPSEQGPDTSPIINNFICAQLTLPKNPIYESDWDFTDAVTQSLCTNHHFHLKYITAGLCQGDYPLQYVLLVQPANAEISMKTTSVMQIATDRKLPVRSLTPGLNTVSAKKLAPLETIFRFKSQPWTPPGEVPPILGLGAYLYRVPVTMSRLCACCSLRVLSSVCLVGT